jgi:small nuclear ribonucleoprotein (snRNP)-like protein
MEVTEEQVKEWMKCTWRVEILDGRIFYGNCTCIDHSMNLILENAKEYREGSI